MGDKKSKNLRRLKLLYLFILILSVILIAPTHLFPQPLFMYARFPYYLEKMGPFLGISWPVTFEIYHWVLISLTIITAFNILGLTFLKWRLAARISSFIGIFFFSSVFLFFIYFIKVNYPVAFAYGIYFFLLLIIDILTFFTFYQSD